MSDYQFRQCLTDDVLYTMQDSVIDERHVSTFVPPRPPRRPRAYMVASQAWLVLCSAGLCVFFILGFLTSRHKTHRLLRWTSQSVSLTLMLTAVVENCLFTALRRNRVILLLAINDIS